MSTVFYRKWRPTRFSDVVGQSHITDTLRRAVQTDRVAHAYLFTGPRGVGKTSTARILAKALNTELDSHGDPLLDTDAAVAIDEGRYMDLIEIDAASNRGVNDIRDLRERVLLRPTVGKYKVYIIDEVHMLTTEAFNALLKTLEEPPPQVVMILATTDIHRVPATIISRCQRFDFRRLTANDVIGRLELICREEGIDCESGVLQLVANSAWGSLRDAENLLEQLAVSYGTGRITEDQARELLGIGDTSSARNLASAILRRDAKQALQIVEEEASRGSELKGLRDGVISSLRGALLTKHGLSGAYGQLGDAPELDPDAMDATAEQMLYAISVLGRNERFGDASSPLALEIAALQAVAEQPRPESAAVGSAPSPSARTSRPPAASSRTTEPRHPASRVTSEPTPSAGQCESADATGILEEIGKAAGTQIRTIFAQANFIGPNDGVLILQPKYSTGAKRLRDTWMDNEIRSKLRAAFQAVYGEEIRVQLQQASASSSRNTTSGASGSAPPPARTSATSGQKAAEPTANQLADDGIPFSIPDEIDSHPAVQRLRNLGGRIVGVE